MTLKDLFLISFFTILFSFLIFIAKNYFFWGIEDFENQIIEEKYIEPTVDIFDTFDDRILEVEKNQKEEESLFVDLEEEPILNIAADIRFSYIPKSFWEEYDVLDYKNSLNDFLTYDSIIKNIELLDVMLYKKEWEVRWKMKNKKLRVYWLYNLSIWEFLSVWIHEFAHFFDLYILKKEKWVDISDYFYSISWEDVSIIKWEQKDKDFVSGYAMTNRYEDFAETYTYYVLHNAEFEEKVKKSFILKEKYDFFEKYVFLKGEFKNTWNSYTEKIKDYYRDITKINFSLQNFLQYLKN